MIWPRKARRELAIDLPAWVRLQADWPCLRGLSDTESDRIRELIAGFLTSKTVSGAQGLEPDDDMRLAIAAQACLPILHLGLSHYGDFVEIVVHPAAFLVQRKLTDEDGLVHEFEDILAGEAMDCGPVVLSWDDIRPQTDFTDAPDQSMSNIVIHEFVHKLDMADGQANGCPPMPASLRQRWETTLYQAFDDLCRQLDAIEAAIPADIDPESEAADAWYARLPLDPYAATDEAEFFAVAAEAFFVSPVSFQRAFPALYECFSAYFRQDPVTRMS
jgi:Mlc titration factor MtfA (ptsG expression regulator)